MSKDQREPLVLVSQSPRRRELLALTGLPFEVQVGDTDETQNIGEDPEAYVRRMAREKALTGRQMASGRAVLAADTIVVDGDQVLGKPPDREAAESMLRHLRAREHVVMTAIAYQSSKSEGIEVELCQTHVPMRPYSDAELTQYLDSGDSLDKAGGYGIQNEDFHPVEKLHGCYANVMGLPLCHLTRMLVSRGHSIPGDVPTACQKFTSYDCPVFESILNRQL